MLRHKYYYKIDLEFLLRAHMLSLCFMRSLSYYINLSIPIDLGHYSLYMDNF